MTTETARYKGVKIIVDNIAASGRKTALPDEALDIVKSSGITTPDYALVKTVEEAIEYSRSIGFPVVLKVASPDGLHKSDIGSVVVDVESEREVENVYNEIIDNIAKEVPDVSMAGILIQKQMPETTQMIVGGIRDEHFGPVVMFGLGGIFVELFKDVVFRIAPVTETEALDMIKEIKGYSVLSGYRGAKVLDIQQLTKTIVSISGLISSVDEIKEVELNPLFVYKKGVIAVDARVIIK